MKRYASVGLAIVSLLILVPEASALIVYDNGGPNVTSGNEVTKNLQAEDFMIAAGAAVTGVSVYIATGTGDINVFNGSVDYFVFTDSAGSPGAQLAGGPGLNVTLTDTGQAWCCGGNAYLLAFDFGSAFTAAAGTAYWFGIHLNGSVYNTDGDLLYWVTADPNGPPTGYQSSGGTQINWTDTGKEHAFYLEAVPEPTTLTVFCLGLIGLAAGALCGPRNGSA